MYMLVILQWYQENCWLCDSRFIRENLFGHSEPHQIEAYVYFYKSDNQANNKKIGNELQNIFYLHVRDFYMGEQERCCFQSSSGNEKITTEFLAASINAQFLAWIQLFALFTGCLNAYVKKIHHNNFKNLNVRI